VETDYDCQSLQMTPAEVKRGQPSIFSAKIANTFLDGSRIFLSVDGGAAGATWAWARNGTAETVSFPLRFESAGAHEIAIGQKRIELMVRP
jgi:hypothetical protein